MGEEIKIPTELDSETTGIQVQYQAQKTGKKEN